MIDHGAVLLACRTKLAALSVATTGSVSLTATSSGYTRSTGSFLTDGFAPGMELVGAGFSNDENNAAKTITSVSTLQISAAGCVAETAGTRSLTVGVPAGVASENIAYTPTQGVSYFGEQYVPGPAYQLTIGPLGTLEARPLYVVTIHVPQKTGVLGTWGYVKALLTLFAPGTALTVTDHVVIVRRDAAPYAGAMQWSDSFATVTVTIPLRVRVANSI